MRVEDAPGNARRIFTGIDIRARVEDVWEVMTNYEGLAEVVPNLVENEVVQRLEHGGARLWQIGRSSWTILGRKFYFQAGTTLEVLLHPKGLCKSGLTAAGERICASSVSSSAVRAEGRGTRIERDTFPRPFSLEVADVPVRDITMQNVLGAKGDFVHYQGVWRLQPLPGCAMPGQDMMRLTFAVECEPHWFLPVAPVEGRIASALMENMVAIRDYAEAKQIERESLGVAEEAATGAVEGKGSSTEDDSHTTFQVPRFEELINDAQAWASDLMGQPKPPLPIGSAP